MPVILETEDCHQWLNEDSRGPDLRSLMLWLEFPDLCLLAISAAVSQSGNDSPKMVTDYSATAAPIEERLL